MQPACANGSAGLQGEVARELYVLPAEMCATKPELTATTDWLLADIRQGVPRLPAEGGSHTAHMLGLDRIQALSLGKGCYPGQEIVARTHYLGQSKRRLGRLRTSDGSLPVFGASVLADAAPCGEVIRACTGTLGNEIQAILSEIALTGALTIDAVAVEWAELGSPPLPDLTA
jgi:folate-binding protein YgfZ